MCLGFRWVRSASKFGVSFVAGVQIEIEGMMQELVHRPALKTSNPLTRKRKA